MEAFLHSKRISRFMFIHGGLDFVILNTENPVIFCILPRSIYRFIPLLTSTTVRTFQYWQGIATVQRFPKSRNAPVQTFIQRKSSSNNTHLVCWWRSNFPTPSFPRASAVSLNWKTVSKANAFCRSWDRGRDRFLCGLCGRAWCNLPNFRNYQWMPMRIL